MPRFSYVNGRVAAHADSFVSIEDRGYQFADGVYEVLAVADGRLCHLDRHLERLGRSLAGLRIAWPVAPSVIPGLLARMARLNRVRNGVVYLQITRGVAPRNHLFPADVAPSLVITAWTAPGPSAKAVEAGVAVTTAPDHRWKRVDLKTICLLPNVLAKQAAKEQGAAESWLVDAQGLVTEGTAANAFIVTKAGTLLTRPADGGILGGVTRANVLDLAARAGIPLQERAFSVAEAREAAEAFSTATTITVLPVTRIDGHAIGNGQPGPVTRRLRGLYQELRRP